MKRTLTYTTYRDKVRGGWIGKCAGGILGAPIEGYKKFNSIPLSDELFETNFPNDDLDLQILWLDMVKRKGPVVRERDFATHWHRHVRFPWCEYGIAYRNLTLGIDPPDSGVHNNHYWYQSMGSPIRSELWGMLCPGMPLRAAYYARFDSCLDHGTFSTDAEKFLSACAAEAFFSDSVEEILRTALKLFPGDSELHQLVTTVSQWAQLGSYEVAMNKIKGYYGDADFTSAPMNVAFTVLALLRSAGEFDSIMDALHLGHDSDCVVATTGALLGIIIGYERLSPRWKELVGDELLVSEEIVSLDHVHTVSELTEETCRAGLSFIEHFGEVTITDAPTYHPPAPPRFHLNVTSPDHYATFVTNELRTLTVAYENLSSAPQSVRIVMQSDELTWENHDLTLTVEAGTTQTAEVSYRVLSEQLEALSRQATRAAFRYQLTVYVDDELVETYEKGIPFYGTWLLLGPFIRDAPELASLDPDFPDHGLSSLPSSRYMNQDRFDPSHEFLTPAGIQEVARAKNYADLPFLAQHIYPTGYRIDLTRYYRGRGERTLYLYTHLHRSEAERVWLVLGCSAHCRVWSNGELVHQQDQGRRAWPYAAQQILSLREGDNDLLIRIDTPVDQFGFEIGFKNFDEKHPHQSFWNTDLVPFV